MFHFLSNNVLYFRKRPTVKQLLDHPWLSQKVHVLPLPEVLSLPPKSIPASQHNKSLPCIPTDTKNQRKTFSSDTLNGSFADSTSRTYNVSTSCLCTQCGTTCRHLPHAPVTKTAITVDRGILC